jgi:cytosolic phospholipase A2
LFVPSVYDKLNPQHLSLHMMRQNIDKGQHPMPIFTAIQHSRSLSASFFVYCLLIAYILLLIAFPPVAIQAMQELQAEEDSGVGMNRMTILEEAKHILKEASSQYLWYEFTPYEVGCDEIGGERFCVMICNIPAEC